MSQPTATRRLPRVGDRVVCCMALRVVVLGTVTKVERAPSMGWSHVSVATDEGFDVTRPLADHVMQVPTPALLLTATTGGWHPADYREALVHRRELDAKYEHEIERG